MGSASVPEADTGEEGGEEAEVEVIDADEEGEEEDVVEEAPEPNPKAPKREAR